VILASDGNYVACGASCQRGDCPEDDPWIQTLIVKMNKEGIYDPDGISTTVDFNEEGILNVYPNLLPQDSILHNL